MNSFQPTIILRHRRENVKKCSLASKEGDPDFLFFTYPRDLDKLPVKSMILLGFEGPLLTLEDASFPLLILDATWRYAKKMEEQVILKRDVIRRTLPSHFQTAYPRRQEDCSLPEQGLASIEALYVAYSILGKKTEGLLDHYYWKDLFLKKNERQKEENNEILRTYSRLSSK